jgi:oxygen-dependent protoporphyrinogen oxidase
MRVVIAGGGISGLSAAYDLRKASIENLLVESNPQLGGVIRTERIEGNLLECGPDSFIAQKTAALELIAELGLADDVIGSNDDGRITFIRKDGKLIPLPDGLMMMVPTKIMPMALSPLLGWGTKLHMGLEYFRKPPASPRPDRSVADFVRDHYGEETLDYVAEPLLSGVYGGDPNKLSVNSVLPRFADLETKYGSLTRGVLAQKGKARGAPAGSAGSLFRTMKTGLGTLVDKLAPPARSMLLNSSVEALESAGGRYRVRINGNWTEARNVILTGPAYQAAKLLTSIDPILAAKLNEIDYSSTATVNLGYKTSRLPKQLVGFGLLVPRKERKRLRACTFVANKFSHRVADGWQVIRCFFGGTGDPAILEESDASIQDHATAEMKELLGISVSPDFCSIARWPRSMAQYTVGHSVRIEEIRSRLKAWPGLFLAGNGYQGIGLPDCVQMGRTAAKSAIGLG